MYFLQDSAGTIRYVGRVADSGYPARMRHHERTRGLTEKHRISGLTREQARGLEEIGMITFHTINAFNPQGNKIHGIGIDNKNGTAYMKAAMEYLSNHNEQFLLNMIE